MKVLIVDDEPDVRRVLRRLLRDYCPDVTQVDEAEGLVSGIRAIHECKPDIVFTDVEMKDGSGMEMLAKIQEPRFQVVFITAYSKYAVDAFKFSAVDFLLKPIDPDDLVKSVARAGKNINDKKTLEQLKVLNENLKEENRAEKKIVLKDQGHIYIFRISEIVYCQADGIYTRFIRGNGERITVSKNLKEFDDLLRPFGFLRVHNSYLVNSGKIEKFEKVKGFLLLSGNHSVPVAQRKKEYLLGLFKKM